MLAVLALLISLFPVTLVAAQDGTPLPTLTTDKLDYAPGEIVHIAGTSFLPGDYALPVKRPDGSIVLIDPVTHAATPGWGVATADANGNLTYDYQLDGIEGTYTVRAVQSPWWGDWSEAPQAEVTFTDALTGQMYPVGDESPSGPGGWTTGNLGGSNSNYAEGETVPFQIEVSGTGTGTLIVCRDYQNGADFGYLFLDAYNTSRSATPGRSHNIEPRRLLRG